MCCYVKSRPALKDPTISQFQKIRTVKLSSPYCIQIFSQLTKLEMLVSLLVRHCRSRPICSRPICSRPICSNTIDFSLKRKMASIVNNRQQKQQQSRSLVNNMFTLKQGYSTFSCPWNPCRSHHMLAKKMFIFFIVYHQLNGKEKLSTYYNWKCKLIAYKIER